MAKIKKAVLVLVIAALACVPFLLTGCSGGGAQIDGIYHYSSISPATIDQGKLIRTTQESMTVFTDNTFSACSVNDTLYSSDGVAYNPTYFAFCDLFGTYEVISEDTVLKEKTIKITDVTKVITADGEFLQENFTAEQAAAVDEALVGKEIILTSDHEIAGGLNAVNALNSVFEA